MKEQWFDFDNYASAKARALELLYQGCWRFELKTLDENKLKKRKTNANKV